MATASGVLHILHILRTLRCASLVPWVVLSAVAAAQDAPAPDRGALLYDTHCRACHGEQLHWRDKRVVRDWAGLKLEVSRWQAAERLNWTEADIVAVARHLNQTLYHLPQTGDVVGQRPATPLAPGHAWAWRGAGQGAGGEPAPAARLR